MRIAILTTCLSFGLLSFGTPVLSDPSYKKDCNNDTAYNINPPMDIDCNDVNYSFLNSFYGDHTPRSYKYKNDRLFKQTSSMKLFGEWAGFYYTNKAGKFGFPDQRIVYDSNSLWSEFNSQFDRIIRNPTYTQDLSNGFNSSIYKDSLIK